MALRVLASGRPVSATGPITNESAVDTRLRSEYGDGADGPPIISKRQTQYSGPRVGMLSLQDYLVSRIFFEPMQWFTYVFLALRPQTRQRTRAQGGMVQTTPTMAMIASGEMLIARSKVKPSKESN
jgi:hypothetical protein